MKSPFLLPLYLVSVFLLFLLCFTAVSMLWTLVAWAPQGLRIAVRAVLERGVSLVEGCLVAALLPAILLTALRVARNPVSRPFSLLLPLGTVFCVLYFGPMGLRALPPPPSAPPQTAPGGIIRAGVLIPATGGDGEGVVLSARMVVPENGEAALVDLVIDRPAGASPRLSWVAEARAAREGASIVVDTTDRAYRVAARPAYLDLLEPGPGTLRFLGDLRIVDRELEAAGSQASAVLLCAGLASFLWFSCFLLRTTRWPLLGLVLVGLAWRGALIGVGFLADVVRPAFLEIAAGSTVALAVAGETLPAALLAASALFLVVDLLFVRFDFWKREIET